MSTAQSFIAQLEARLGKPYSETVDGGVGPDYYDCSGLVDVCLNAIGISCTRTTYSQWADQRYEHLPANTALQVGDVVYMHVAGEPDPGHVGVYVGNGEYINAPHTGAFVRIEAIPSTPSEHIFGVIRPPFAAPTPTPAPKPAPPIIATLGEEMAEGPTVIESSDGNRHVFQTLGAPGSETNWHWWQNMKGTPNWAWNCEELTAAKT